MFPTLSHFRSHMEPKPFILCILLGVHTILLATAVVPLSVNSSLFPAEFMRARVALILATTP